MGVAAQIGEHGFGAAEGWFVIHHPLRFAERSKPCRKGIHPRWRLQIAAKGEVSGLVQRHQPVQKETSDQTRQHPHVQKEPGLASDPSVTIRR